MTYQASSIRPGEARADGLAPYAQCPRRTPDACRFAALAGAPRSAPHTPEISVHQCSTCGHGVTRPALPDVAALYEARDSQDFQPAESGIAQSIKRFAFRRQARQMLARVPGPPPANVIDFACGSGLFTKLLGEVLPASTAVHALDFFPTPPRGLGRVRYSAFADMDALAGTADLVFCLHTLEHDDDPHALLARVLSLLAPGGHLLVEVPNVDCVWSKVWGKAWDNWYLPFHRVHFSRASLRALFESAGLDVVAAHDVAIPSMGRSLARATGRSNTLPFLLAGAALHPVQMAGEAITRRPSALQLVARKPV